LVAALGKGESETLQTMKAYRILVHDDRTATPIEFCRKRLASSAYVASIEVWSGARKLCQLWSEARQAA
jgi:hypothetical protein